jgi:uncharacterized protein YqhQ
MDICGGTSSSTNSVSMYSRHYKATATLFKNTNEIEVTNEKIPFENKPFYLKIPIIGSIIIHIYQMFYIKGLVEINLLPILYIVIYTLDKLIFKLNILHYLFGLYYIFAFAYIRITDMSKLHGAEHAVYNYYTKYKSLEDVEKIKEESLVVNRCGTTYMIVTLILFYVIPLKDTMLRYFLCTGLAGDIVYLIENNKIFQIIGKPIIMLSRLIQKLIATRKPETVHVKMTTMAVKKLEELESK